MLNGNMLSQGIWQRKWRWLEREKVIMAVQQSLVPRFSLQHTKDLERELCFEVILTVQSRQTGFTSSLARSSQVFSLLSSSSQLRSTAHMLSRVAFSLLCSDCSDRMYRWAYSIAAELLAVPLSVNLRKKNSKWITSNSEPDYLLWLLTIIFTHYGVKIFIHTSDPAISSEGVHINQM